ncbi:MAG TPA: FAD-dependent monooxygenase [Pyrinomonadaceae bacterium]|nr:FAD-dependent monooxygenase [Pyrinomonadaceae bacterium]
MSYNANTFDVIIAGAGPAGASAAIRLAGAGAHVLLVEEKKFPRAKLCGEFISPECLTHFKQLEVMESMTAAGGDALTETVFYSRRGHSVKVPSEWFKAGTPALGLSRSEMDQQLLQRARSAGVVVLEETHVSRLLLEKGIVRGIAARNGMSHQEFTALMTIDATGRTRALARHLDPASGGAKQQKPLVAFKAHLSGARLANNTCEMYFYRRGYGGLNSVEGGLSNLCFIVASSDVRQLGSDPEVVLREIVKRNPRAAYTLAEATTQSPWLSVSLESFGRRTLAPAAGLMTVGDAAAFIDPFTGSGMLMALESGQVAAEAIAGNLTQLRRGLAQQETASAYRTQYHQRFDSRLRIAGLLRRAAFVPYLDEAAILLFGTSSRLRRKLARATRQSRAPRARASSV